MNNAIVAGFGKQAVVALFYAMLAVGVAMKNGAFVWLATALLNNKYVERKGYLAVFIILFAAWLCGSFMPIVMCVILFYII